MNSSNCNKSKLTRPNLEELIVENPMENPTLAKDDILKIGIHLVAVTVADETIN